MKSNLAVPRLRSSKVTEGAHQPQDEEEIEARETAPDRLAGEPRQRSDVKSIKRPGLGGTV